MLINLQPDFEFMEGNALVPAKALEYKTDINGNIIEVVKPRTHIFENKLKAEVGKLLEKVKIFPTKKEVFVSVTYAINSEREYNGFDLDNRTKALFDALKGVVYDDDSQVKILVADKLFLKNSSEFYYKFSIKILSPRIEKLIRHSLEKVRA